MFKFLTKNILPEPEYGENCKVFNLVQKFFERAQQENCHEIIFGVPPGETLEDKSEELAEEFKKSYQELNEYAKAQGLDIKIPDKIEVSAIPVWMKVEEKWRQVYDIPISLLHECIRAMYFHSDPESISEVHVKLSIETGTAYAKLDLNENFNYRLSDIQIK